MGTTFGPFTGLPGDILVISWWTVIASQRSHYGTELKVPNVIAVVKVHLSHRSRKTVKTPFLLVLGLLVGVASGASSTDRPAMAPCGQVCGGGAQVSTAAGNASVSSPVIQADLGHQVREADQNVRSQRIRRLVVLLSRYSNFAIAW